MSEATLVAYGESYEASFREGTDGFGVYLKAKGKNDQACDGKYSDHEKFSRYRKSGAATISSPQSIGWHSMSMSLPTSAG